MTTQTRARLKLLGVFMIFLGPLALAYLMYYGLSYGGPSTNKGELLDPPIRLPDFSVTAADGSVQPSGQLFEQIWTILQVAPAGCGEACTESLAETRQIRALLHRRSARVQRVMLTDTPQPGAFEQHPDLAVYTASLDGLMPELVSHGAGAPGTIYLVDPLGNWMLFYPPEGDGSALFEDIKHLLKLSHIG